ncbi:MAG TPA: HAD family hydrolase [Porphyromonadaceae bacterium]|nr:HAD family hydrolase [Porphyromonadaceae bacterium]
MQELKNIIFDFGGVLIDWNPLYLYHNVFKSKEEMEYFLREICSPEWNIQQDAGRPLAEATALLQAEHPEYREQITLFYDRWEKMLGGEIEENVRLVKPLSEKYPVYGLTNWSSEMIPVAFKRYDFFRYLKGIVVSGEEKVAKPDPRLYQVLLDRYNLNASESLFIDDNARNIETARQMGFQTIHLTERVNLEKVLKEMNVL